MATNQNVALLALHQQMKAMKLMKAMKKKISWPSGRGTKIQVWNGTRAFTSSGLTNSNLTKRVFQKTKIVSKKQQRAGKKAYTRISGWTDAVLKARNALGIEGFVLIKKGTPLYLKAKEFYQ
jgi:hypothetical protein